MRSRGHILLRKVELEGFKLLIAVQIALEVLQEHHLFVDGLGVLEEVEVADGVGEALHCLSVAVEGGLLSAALDVIKVEKVRVQDDLRAVVEKHAVRVVRQFVTESVFGREVDKLDHELGTGLAFRLLDEQVMIDGQSDCLLDLGELR